MKMHCKDTYLQLLKKAEEKIKTQHDLLKSHLEKFLKLRKESKFYEASQLKLNEEASYRVYEFLKTENDHVKNIKTKLRELLRDIDELMYYIEEEGALKKDGIKMLYTCDQLIEKWKKQTITPIKLDEEWTWQRSDLLILRFKNSNYEEIKEEKEETLEKETYLAYIKRKGLQTGYQQFQFLNESKNIIVGMHILANKTLKENEKTITHYCQLLQNTKKKNLCIKQNKEKMINFKIYEIETRGKLLEHMLLFIQQEQRKLKKNTNLHHIKDMIKTLTNITCNTETLKLDQIDQDHPFFKATDLCAIMA